MTHISHSAVCLSLRCWNKCVVMLLMVSTDFKHTLQQGYSISFEWGPVGGNDPEWGARKKRLKLMSIIQCIYFLFILSNRDQQLIKNNPYLINVIGCLLVFNNLISSGKDNRLTLQQLIKLHSYRLTQECNSLSKYR